MGEITTVEPSFAVAAMVLLAVGLIWERVRVQRGRALVAAWMRENGFVPLRVEPRWIRRGPFFVTASRYQLVYRLEAEDLHYGERRTGWARVGGWWVGLLTEKVEVRWDATSPNQVRRSSDILRSPRAARALGAVPSGARPSPGSI